MKITLIQTDIVWADPIANRRHIEDMLETLPHSDVYVLPEMFSTGFVTDPKGVAEPLDKQGNTYEWMLEMAVRYDAAFAGSVATETSDKEYRNRFYFAKPNGELFQFNKKDYHNHEGFVVMAKYNKGLLVK